MISGPVVIDASVAVEYLVTLRFTSQASRVFARLLDPSAELELWAPDLIFPEAASALRKLVARKLLDTRGGARAVQALARLPISATGTAGLLVEAWGLRDAMTVHEACYVVLARRMSVPLITADGHLARAVSARRDRVVLLSEIDA